MKLTRFEEWIEATKALFFFRRYTAMPRLLEIGYSAVAWGCLFVILWAVTGCGGNSGTNTAPASSDPDPSDFSEIRQVLVDDCEYLIWQGYRMGNIIHKANCKNPIHKCEK